MNETEMSGKEYTIGSSAFEFTSGLVVSSFGVLFSFDFYTSKLVPEGL
jgi:hypothetical protein